MSISIRMRNAFTDDWKRHDAWRDVLPNRIFDGHVNFVSKCLRYEYVSVTKDAYEFSLLKYINLYLENRLLEFLF